jgi:hypothetical protein
MAGKTTKNKEQGHTGGCGTGLGIHREVNHLDYTVHISIEQRNTQEDAVDDTKDRKKD